MDSPATVYQLPSPNQPKYVTTNSESFRADISCKSIVHFVAPVSQSLHPTQAERPGQRRGVFPGSEMACRTWAGHDTRENLEYFLQQVFWYRRSTYQQVSALCHLCRGLLLKKFYIQDQLEGQAFDPSEITSAACAKTAPREDTHFSLLY